MGSCSNWNFQLLAFFGKYLKSELKMAISSIFQLRNFGLALGSCYILFYHLKWTTLRDCIYHSEQNGNFWQKCCNFFKVTVKMAIFNIFELINLGPPWGSCYLLFYHLKLQTLRHCTHSLEEIWSFWQLFWDYSKIKLKNGNISV